MRPVIGICLGLASAFWAGAVLAHVTNEKTAYVDIADIPERFDIMLLVSLQIVPAGEAFGPADPLTRHDLAVWAGGLAGHGEAHEDLDPDAAAQASLEAGLITSLEGEATYADLAQVFGTAPADGADAVPTRAEAAAWIAEILTAAPQGLALLAARNVTLGGAGIAAVEQEASASGGKISYVTIDGTRAAVHAHAKLANGPIDLGAWDGHWIARSLLTQTEDGAFWLYLEADAPIGGADARHHGEADH